MVLEPIEPVAPSSVTDFGTRARSGLADGCCCCAFFMGLPYQQALTRCIGPLPEDADQKRDERRKQKAVETIHQSSVTGYQAARILGAETPLDRGFEQVASLGKDRKHERHHPYGNKLIDPARIGDRGACGNPPQNTANGARPGLVRTYARPQQWAAERPADRVGGHDGCPT